MGSGPNGCRPSDIHIFAYTYFFYAAVCFFLLFICIGCEGRMKSFEPNIERIAMKTQLGSWILSHISFLYTKFLGHSNLYSHFTGSWTLCIRCLMKNKTPFVSVKKNIFSHVVPIWTFRETFVSDYVICFLLWDAQHLGNLISLDTAILHDHVKDKINVHWSCGCRGSPWPLFSFNVILALFELIYPSFHCGMWRGMFSFKMCPSHVLMDLI